MSLSVKNLESRNYAFVILPTQINTSEYCNIHSRSTNHGCSNNAQFAFSQFQFRLFSCVCATFESLFVCFCLYSRGYTYSSASQR